MNPELENPYFRSARRWGAGFGLCMILAFGGGFLKLLPIFASILIGAVGGTLCLIFWLALWFTAQSLEGELEAFRQGNVIDCWVLSADDYQRWWEDLRQKLGLAGLTVGAMLVLAGTVLALIFWIDEHKPEVGGAILGGSLLLGATVAWLVRQVMSGRPPTGEGSYTLWIGPDLAILGGHVRRWQGPGLRLTTASALDQPPRLRVDYAAAVKSGWVQQVVEFPAPDLGRAAAVAAQLEAGRRS